MCCVVLLFFEVCLGFRVSWWGVFWCLVFVLLGFVVESVVCVLVCGFGVWIVIV